jgi:hypothetical protein
VKITLLKGMDDGGILQGTPKSLKEPSTEDRMVSRAHDAKVDATDRWVRGEMTGKDHEAVHRKADHVIKCRGKLK